MSSLNNSRASLNGRGVCGVTIRRPNGFCRAGIYAKASAPLGCKKVKAILRCRCPCDDVRQALAELRKLTAAVGFGEIVVLRHGKEEFFSFGCLSPRANRE